MRMCEFTYHRPKSLAELFEFAARLGPGCMLLAGGTEALPEFKRGRAGAEHLLSLRDVTELRGIREDGGGLRIGATTPHEEVAASPLVRRVFPALAEAAAAVGSAQIRRQGTIGGNFCGAVPCADTPPPCIAGAARLRIVSPLGSREMPAEEFFLGPRRCALDAHEVLAEIVLPPPPPGSGAAYARFGLRAGMAVAVAAVAARLTIEGGVIREARVVLGAVAPVPLPAISCNAALAGRPPTPETFAAAARAAAAEAKPITDIRGSAEYRRELVAVLTVRALDAAARRARGGAA